MTPWVCVITPGACSYDVSRQPAFRIWESSFPIEHVLWWLSPHAALGKGAVYAQWLSVGRSGFGLQVAVRGEW